MSKRKIGEKLNNEVNAGSMADIAFLLLIFFLVTTTIAEDKGIYVLLPQWFKEDNIVQIDKNNVFTVLVNKDNKLLVEDDLIELNTLKNRAKEFISNPLKKESLPENPRKAIISLKTDRGTKYETYLLVYNELKAAYNELRNDLANRKFGKSFNRLNESDMQFVKTEIPIILSEAEPTAFGSEE